MLYRLAEHFVGMKIPKEHKYRILAEAKRRGYKVNFDVLYNARSSLPSEIEEEIGSFGINGSTGTEWLNMVELSELTSDYFIRFWI